MAPIGVGNSACRGSIYRPISPISSQTWTKIDPNYTNGYALSVPTSKPSASAFFVVPLSTERNGERDDAKTKTVVAQKHERDWENHFAAKSATDSAREKQQNVPQPWLLRRAANCAEALSIYLRQGKFRNSARISVVKRHGI